MPSTHDEEGVRCGGGKETEYFSDFRVGVQAPALLWLKCSGKKGRECASKTRGEVKKCRKVGVLHEVRRGRMWVHYIGEGTEA